MMTVSRSNSFQCGSWKFRQIRGEIGKKLGNSSTALARNVKRPQSGPNGLDISISKFLVEFNCGCQICFRDYRDVGTVEDGRKI
jgi:hypothetical protein